MTLKRRLQLYVASFALALAVLAAVCLATLAGMNQKLGDALAEYERLRWGYEAGVLIARARESALDERAKPQVVYDHLLAARVSMSNQRLTPAEALSAAEPLDRALQAWRHATPALGERAAALQAINQALSAITGLCQRVRLHIDTLERDALDQQRHATLMVATISGLLILAAFAVGWRHYRAIIGPVSDLRRVSGALADGKWDQRLRPQGDCELADTARDFNRMAQQLQGLYLDLESQVRTRSAQLVRSERLATVGMLAAGVAHEINNPLAIIHGQAELALDQVEPTAGGATPVAQALRMILDETQRCKAITHKLLSLSRPSTPSRAPLDLAPLLITTADAMRALAQRKGCELRLQTAGPESATVRADAMEMRQVLVNLLLNAIEAAPSDAGVVELAVGGDDQHAWISVTDNGDGMDAATLGRLFEPFFTHRTATRPGQGLGLAVSQAIVASHGGELVAQSPGKGLGSHFTVRMPRLSVLAEVAP